ncbi:sex comb on midleg-like protein 4 isoform X3 [Paramormyrops kingsleyae]|uniref:sex comb on midleg-like protein 4 isoform X3 n=1 Tax=Paramormyrops kingsleyae TaxID=1676925 RepID=UPI003B970CF1
MRLRGRDIQDPTVSWISSILGVQSVRLRLRLDRRDDKGRGCWQLVDLGGDEDGRKPCGEATEAFSQSSMSIPAASVQKADGGDMQEPVVGPSFIPGQRGKIPGRKRGRPPLRNVPKMDFPNRYTESLSPLKVPKKRGRKPGFKLKSRMVMTPLAISPPSSTPEPDMSSIPQDAATVPHSATPQVLTVCIYINKQANTGPNLDRKKVQQLPDHFGPDRPSVVLQQAVQGCIDSAFQQKAVFSLLTQGYGGEKISADTSMPEDYLVDPIDSKRYSVDPSDSAFNTMNSPYPPKPYGYRVCQPFPGGSAPPGLCRQTASPSTFQEGNRSAYSPSPESQESKPPPSKDPSTWTVEDVVWFVKDADPLALGPHVEVFRKHEIDGYALLLLKSDMIMKYLGLKLGPALKLCYHIDKLKQAKF